VIVSLTYSQQTYGVAPEILNVKARMADQKIESISLHHKHTID